VKALKELIRDLNTAFKVLKKQVSGPNGHVSREYTQVATQLRLARNELARFEAVAEAQALDTVPRLRALASLAHEHGKAADALRLEREANEHELRLLREAREREADEMANSDPEDWIADMAAAVEDEHDLSTELCAQLLAAMMGREDWEEAFSRADRSR
jgi:hypothetical protein